MTWNDFFNEEKQKDYYDVLMNRVLDAYNTTSCLPKYDEIFNAFNMTEFDNVKVVIIGQDPYQTKEFPMGLCFSVNKGVKIPRSLNNIYKELNYEFGFKIPNSGDISSLTRKGVLLLNTILTVEEGKPLSHKNFNWQELTSNAIRFIEEHNNKKVVYLLFGAEAQKISTLVTNPNHLVLSCAHPSPLSASRGFFYSNVFKKASEYLELEDDFWEIIDE